MYVTTFAKPNAASSNTERNKTKMTERSAAGEGHGASRQLRSAATSGGAAQRQEVRAGYSLFL